MHRAAAERVPRRLLSTITDPPASHAVRDLAPPGELTTQASLAFEFGAVEMQYESYRGAQVRPEATAGAGCCCEGAVEMQCE